MKNFLADHVCGEEINNRKARNLAIQKPLYQTEVKEIFKTLLLSSEKAGVADSTVVGKLLNLNDFLNRNGVVFKTRSRIKYPQFCQRCQRENISLKRDVPELNLHETHTLSVINNIITYVRTYVRMYNTEKNVKKYRKQTSAGMQAYRHAAIGAYSHSGTSTLADSVIFKTSCMYALANVALNFLIFSRLNISFIGKENLSMSSPQTRITATTKRTYASLRIQDTAQSCSNMTFNAHSLGSTKQSPEPTAQSPELITYSPELVAGMSCKDMLWKLLFSLHIANAIEELFKQSFQDTSVIEIENYFLITYNAIAHCMRSHSMYGCLGGYKVQMSRIYSQDLKIKIYCEHEEDMGDLNKIDYYSDVENVRKEFMGNNDDCSLEATEFGAYTAIA
ncbi:hypothetical protein GQX74_008904 [Glossina fuscipes]|nr:hypothetical protein GQX74_008904 [Glossina fuscipes]